MVYHLIEYYLNELFQNVSINECNKKFASEHYNKFGLPKV